jgi:hypothetical protein
MAGVGDIPIMATDMDMVILIMVGVDITLHIMAGITVVIILHIMVADIILQFM